MVEWRRQLEADIAAVDRAIEREHQAAIAAGKPWPPERVSAPKTPAQPASLSRPAYASASIAAAMTSRVDATSCDVASMSASSRSMAVPFTRQE